VTLRRAIYSVYRAHSGIQSVQMGGLPGEPVRLCHSSLHRSFTIPADALSADLIYWRWRGTDAGIRAQGPWAVDGFHEGVAKSSLYYGEDLQEVLLLEDDHISVAALLERSRSHDDGWTQATYDLLPWRGQTVIVYWNAYNDGLDGRTWMYVDDVEIEVCRAID